MNQRQVNMFTRVSSMDNIGICYPGFSLTEYELPVLLAFIYVRLTQT